MNIREVPGRILIDSSIGIKLFRNIGEEPFVEMVPSILDGRSIYVCSAFWVEVGHNIYRIMKEEKLDNIDIFSTERDELFESAFSILDQLRIQTKPIELDEMRRSYEFAMNVGHPTKDCMFAWIALTNGITLLTADNKLHKKTISAYSNNFSGFSNKRRPASIHIKDIEL